MEPPKLQLPYAFRELQEPSRHKAFHGGRGGGKSWAYAQELIIRGWERRELRWLCAREIQKSINASVKRLMEDRIKAAGLGPVADGGNGFYHITDRGITGNDGKVQFLFSGLRSNPENVKSMEGLDGAWIEEANTVSQRSINLLTPTVRKEGSELWWSWNRRHEKDPVDNMFLSGAPPPRSLIRKVGWQDNPWFSEVLREEMEWDKSRDMDKYLHVWEGHPVKHSEAQVFKNWVVEDIDDLVPAGCIARLGADWGFSIDPTVVIECYVFGRTLYFRREAYKIRCTIDDTPALFAGSDTRERKRWENRYGHPGLESVRQGGRIVADSARPETIKYLRDRGFNILSAKKGARSVEEGVEFIKSFDVVIHPDCTHTVNEFTYYKYKEDPLTDEILPILADRDNHLVDAARYALEGVRKAHRGRISTCGGAVIPL